MSFYLALLLRPVGMLIFLGLIVLPITLWLSRRIPEGRLKRVLYKKRTAWWDRPWLLRKRRPSTNRQSGRTLEQ